MTSDKSVALEQRFNAHVNASGPDPANVSIVPITATGPTQILAKTIPGGTLAASLKWTMEWSGYFTSGAVAPTGVAFSVSWGPVGNALSGTQVINFAIPNAGLLASAAALGARVEVTVWGMSATSLAVSMRVWWHTASGIAGSVSWFSNAKVTGLTSNVDRDLNLAFGYAGSGVTLTTDAAQIARAA